MKAGTLFGERLNQVDLRVGKIFRFGARRVSVHLDVFNALNDDTVLTMNNAFGTWQRPTSIMLARFAKIQRAAGLLRVEPADTTATEPNAHSAW